MSTLNPCFVNSTDETLFGSKKKNSPYRGSSRLKLRLTFDAALNDLFFPKTLFYQKQCKYAMNIR